MQYRQANQLPMPDFFLFLIYHKIPLIGIGNRNYLYQYIVKKVQESRFSLSHFANLNGCVG
jgi:hypothetical protein